jgi:hypothetical protein
MERNDFLKMCQRVSMLPDGVMHTKKNVPNELQVCFDGKYYYPAHLEIKFDENGKVKNIAVLHDLEANCLLCVKLDLVEKLTTE